MSKSQSMKSCLLQWKWHHGLCLFASNLWSLMLQQSCDQSFRISPSRL